MMEYFFYGTVLGLSAGFSPGPLLALVVAETLRHNFGGGLRVALAPLLTDVPIVLVVLLVLMRLADYHALLGWIAVSGAGFLLFLGWQSLRFKRPATETAAAPPRSLVKGVVTNFLSPHPYLFWITVGGPLVTRAWSDQAGGATAFVCAFYLCLIGSKVVLAALVGRSRNFLIGRAYPLIMRGLGILLLLLALLLFYDGVSLMSGVG